MAGGGISQKQKAFPSPGHNSWLNTQPVRVWVKVQAVDSKREMGFQQAERWVESSGVWGQALATSPVGMKLNPDERLQGSLRPRWKVAQVRRTVREPALPFYSFMILKLKTRCTFTEHYRNNLCSTQAAQNPHSQFIRWAYKVLRL